MSLSSSVVAFTRDANDSKLFHMPDDGMNAEKQVFLSQTITLASISASKAIPEKIEFDDKILELINVLIEEDENLHEVPLGVPVVYGRGAARVRNATVRLLEEDDV